MCGPAERTIETASWHSPTRRSFAGRRRPDARSATSTHSAASTTALSSASRPSSRGSGLVRQRHGEEHLLLADPPRLEVELDRLLGERRSEVLLRKVDARFLAQLSSRGLSRRLSGFERPTDREPVRRARAARLGRVQHQHPARRRHGEDTAGPPPPYAALPGRTRAARPLPWRLAGRLPRASALQPHHDLPCLPLPRPTPSGPDGPSTARRADMSPTGPLPDGTPFSDPRPTVGP